MGRGGDRTFIQRPTPPSPHHKQEVRAFIDRVRRDPALLLTKVRLVKAMVFPVVVYGCESWTIKKAEHWRTDAFELWCWRRFLRVPWTAGGSNQSILKKISPEYSLEGLMLKLKLHYFSHLMQRTDSLEKTLMLGKTEGRRRGRQRMRRTWVWASYRSFWWTGKPGLLQFMGSQTVGHDWVTELIDWGAGGYMQKQQSHLWQSSSNWSSVVWPVSSWLF